MARDHVKALYVGSPGYELEDRTQLIPGETVVEIPRGEADADNRWEPIQPKKKAAS